MNAWQSHTHILPPAFQDVVIDMWIVLEGFQEAVFVTRKIVFTIDLVVIDGQDGSLGRERPIQLLEAAMSCKVSRRQHSPKDTASFDGASQNRTVLQACRDAGRIIEAPQAFSFESVAQIYLAWTQKLIR